MTPQEAALWMLERYRFNNEVLYQEDAASHLLHLHDPDLAYFDDSGNLCVGKSVLSFFNKLTPHAVYERTDKFWRERFSSDQPGRQQ